ncbi:MAG: hypothetical protein ABI693_08470 [Bryobacteraceae bacterium]
MKKRIRHCAIGVSVALFAYFVAKLAIKPQRFEFYSEGANRPEPGMGAEFTVKDGRVIIALFAAEVRDPSIAGLNGCVIASETKWKCGGEIQRVGSGFAITEKYSQSDPNTVAFTASLLCGQSCQSMGKDGHWVRRSPTLF